jgi:hypothetical protein
VVPRAGIEPALLSEPDFESGASTNSANGARKVFSALSCAIGHVQGGSARKHAAMSGDIRGSGTYSMTGIKVVNSILNLY